MKEKQTIVTCPICGKPYQVAEEAPEPTCGDPNCVRKARSQGLPFAPGQRQPEKLPPAAEKPRKKGR